MRNKKFVLGLLSLLMVATAGVACNGTPDQDSTPSPDSSSSVQEMNVELSLDKAQASIHLFERVTLSAKVKGTSEDVEWSSLNPNVATVSADGVVIPVAVGTATIRASVAGRTAECVVTISQHQGDIDIIVPYDTLELDMGSTKNISASGCLGLLNDLDGGVYTYNIADTSIVSVAQDGTVTPLKVGNTTIEINGTFKGITATGITVPVVVKEFEQESIATTIDFYANRQNELAIDLSAYNFDEITSFEIDGRAYAYTLSGKVLSVAKTQFTKMEGGFKDIVILGSTPTSNLVIDAQLNYVNYAIGTADEFNAFQQVYANKRGTEEDRNGVYTKVLLTGNIDLNGGTLRYSGTACNFYGYFDGQGYTVKNFVGSSNSIFYKIGDTRYEQVTTFKNVAFVDGTRPSANAGGILAYGVENVVMENVYIQGRQVGTGSGNTPGYAAAIADYAQSNNTPSTVEIRNCFVQIESEGCVKLGGALVARAQEGVVTIENCYAVSSTAVGLYGQFVGTDDQGYDSITQNANKTNLYTSVSDFMEDVQAVPFGFDIDMWEMRGGLLMFKSAAQDWDVVEIAGQQFAANNRAQFLLFDLTGQNVQDATVEYILAGGSPVTNYEFSNGKLSLDIDGMTARGEVDVVATLKTATGKLTVNAQAYVVDYAIGTVDEFVEFQQLYGTKRGTTEDRSTKYTYVILTDNIDMAGTNLSYSGTACKFYGYFDGQGYAIRNFVINSNSVLFQIGNAACEEVTTFKNVAFTDCTRPTRTAGGVLAEFLENAVLDNIYVEAYELGLSDDKGNAPGYTAALSDYTQNGGVAGKTVVIRNCLAVIESEGYLKMAGALVARAQQGVTSFENSYAVSSTAVGLYGQYAGTDDQAYLYISQKAVQDNLYKTAQDFRAVVQSVPTGFNTAYWEMKDGMLVFKSAYKDTVVLAEQVVASNRGQSLELDMSSYDVVSIDGVSVLGSTITDYTYENNKVTVPFADLIKGHSSVLVKATTANGTLYVKAKTYAVDFAIGSVEELNAFGAACQGRSDRSTYTYAVLTNHVNYNNGFYTDVYSSGTFFGCFDGQGYTISNMKVRHSFFVAIHGIANGKRSVIKNFGLVNILKNTANGGGLLANDMLYTDVDNVYVSGKVELYQSHVCGAIAGTAKDVNITNCVTEIRYEQEGEFPALVGIVQGTTSVNNTYVIMTGNSTGGLSGDGTLVVTNSNQYASAEEAFADMTAVPDGFNPLYWSMQDGALTFTRTSA